jgi:hypothetical protein
MRGMADFQSTKSHFETNNLFYYTFCPKSKKQIKAVIRHLPHSTLAEDISNGLVGLSFDVISVKQMTATRPSPHEGSETTNLPLFLADDGKIPRNLPTAKPLPYHNQGSGI